MLVDVGIGVEDAEADVVDELVGELVAVEVEDEVEVLVEDGVLGTVEPEGMTSSSNETEL